MGAGAIWVRGALVLAAVLAWGPATSQSRTPPPVAQPPQGPFGLSPRAAAQAQKIFDQIKVLAQQPPKPAQQTPVQPPAVQTPAAQSPVAKPPGAVGPGAKGPPPSGVDWPGAVGGQRKSYGEGPKLAGGLRLDPAAVDRTSIPILLLQGPGFDRARLYSFGDYYSISADLTGAQVSMTGAVETVNMPAATPLTVSAGSEQLVVQRTVDGQLASFVRYNVLYTVELRCDLPEDPRCRTEALVRDMVARNTVVLLGKAARQAAGLGG